MMFSVGDKVKWSSQSQGFTKEKVGVVAQVVPGGMFPDRSRFPHLYKNAGIGGYRDHESYVVMVKTKPYWPRANKLEMASGPQMSKDELVVDTYRKAVYAAVPVLSEVITTLSSVKSGLTDDLKQACSALVAAQKYDNATLGQS